MDVLSQLGDTRIVPWFMPGSQELDKWLSTLKVYSKLKKLVLSNASLVIGAVQVTIFSPL